jgi:hypothetical protein
MTMAKCITAFLVGVGLAVSVTFAIAQESEPDAQYQALLKAYTSAAGAFRSAATDEQRMQAVEQFAAFPQKLVDLAERHRGSSIAPLALRHAIQAVISFDSQTQYCWELNQENFPDALSHSSSQQIVDILLRDYLKSDVVAQHCDRMRYGIRPEFETFLSAALEENPHRDVQGLACLALGQLWRNQLYVADRVADRPDWIPGYDGILGRDYFESIRGTGRADLESRMEAMFERALQFDDVKNFTFSETIAEKARSELFDLRHLSVGKTAPDIEGVDQDGRHFKLSDYRGKVVLLYFWMEY